MKRTSKPHPRTLWSLAVNNALHDLQKRLKSPLQITPTQPYFPHSVKPIPSTPACTSAPA